MLVAVPEAEPIVGEWRRRHTHDAPLGLAAHVTLLFPFVPATRVPEAEERLARLIVRRRCFEVSFGSTALWPEVLYLEPEPAEPFAELTAAIAGEWPEHPPYEGAHETVIPHLTVAESDDAALLRSIAAEVELHLPVVAAVTAASVFVEDEDARWHEHARLPLAEARETPRVVLAGH